MPKIAAELSPLAVKRLERPGVHAVGGVAGLALQISPSGARSWLLRARVGGKQREFGLGGYPTVPLATARERARLMREQIWQGIDPVAHRKALRDALVAEQVRRLSFADAVARYLETPAIKQLSDKQRERWPGALNIYAVPEIGFMSVAQITEADIKRILSPIWSTKTDVARRLRSRMETVLGWARIEGYRDGPNPASVAVLGDWLKHQGKAPAGNQPALAIGDAPAWHADLRQRAGIGSRALEFLMLTASRSGEVRGALCDEIDLAAGLWIVPAARMKMKREHRVPLSAAALALLQALPRFADNPLVFPAARGGQLSDMALSATMRRMDADAKQAGRPGWLDPRSKRPAVPHGLRSTFRDWAAERTNYPQEMAEMALAHAIGNKVEAAYRRGDMLEKRRTMMVDWGIGERQGIWGAYERRRN